MSETLSSWKTTPHAERGILCGSDRAQEWLLPWWWSRYSEHNHFPVTFCDFGMSLEARAWCAERGEVVTVESSLAVTPREEVDPLLVADWEARYTPSLWKLRPLWFKKIFAFLYAPYARNLWIDLDCEILKSIAPLFEHCTREAQIGIMREFLWDELPRFHPDILYNSGVIVFDHGAPLIQAWAASAEPLNHCFFGDENLLSHLIHTKRVPVIELPGIYNWRFSQGININAVIVHWLGGGGKSLIRQSGGFKPLLDQFYKGFR